MVKYVPFSISTGLKLQVPVLILIDIENNEKDLKSFDTYSSSLFPAPLYTDELNWS